VFDIISGYQTPDAGRVVFDGVDITALPPEQRARRKLVRRFQDARMFGSLTVFETILVSLEQRVEVRSTFLAAFGAPQYRRAERRLRLRAERLIELLELGAFRDKFVNELSTGLRRIVDLACVLAAEPRVLLLDDPTRGIDPGAKHDLYRLLGRLAGDGVAIVLLSTDVDELVDLMDRVLVFRDGEVFAELAKPRLTRHALVASFFGRPPDGDG
jgi:branched-chain amino acid transport system ATP-binding protein